MKLFVWDLDGTLIDSYKKIVDVLDLLFKEYTIKASKDEIYRFITINSVHELLNRLSNKYKDAKDRYYEIYDSLDYENRLMPNVKETLEYLMDNEYKHIIYTHKGLDTYQIIKDLNIEDYFIEVITIDNGFKRKPDIEAFEYIKHKYSVEKAYYVGDRLLDMDFAYNAGIDGILYLTKGSYIEANGHEKYIVYDLAQIKGII